MQSMAQQLEQRIQLGAAAHRDVVNLVSDYVDLLCGRAQYRVLTFGFSVKNMQRTQGSGRKLAPRAGLCQRMLGGEE
jgi:hypothetical protein